MAEQQSGKCNVDKVLEDFRKLKADSTYRNREYWLLRNAYRGNFRWPADWPSHVQRVTHNYCRPIVNKHVAYLMGKGFTYNVERPNSLDFRRQAELTEKILRRILRLSSADIQFTEGARTGSKLGRSVFKVYKKGKKGAEHACFAYCQPDYFYGIPIGPDSPGEFSAVYYSYPIDMDEARRRYGNKPYKSEREMTEYDRYNNQIGTDAQPSTLLEERRTPVLEYWTKEHYVLCVGGVEIFNGANPYKWSDTGEGFIPFVVVENIRDDAVGYGEADIKEARLLNERFNYAISRRDYVVQRWLDPTLVWEGAPQNYAESLAATVGGGGVLPTRIGSRLSFLSYDRPNPSVGEQLMELRSAILDASGMNEAAYQGVVAGSINTGPALAVQFQPLLAVVEGKRKEWEVGLRRLFAMLLQVQESIGDSKALGQAVINQDRKSRSAVPLNPMAEPTEEETNPALLPIDGDGELVTLSGKDIAGLRDIEIAWPGVLPADDYQAARLELEKLSAGIQSVYTTMEKLGEQYPDDEISRIRMENEDPSLRGEKVAEQTRAEMPLLKQAMDQDFQLQQMQMQQPPPDPEALASEVVPDAVPPREDSELGARIREAARASRARLNAEEDMPVIETGRVAY